MSVCPKCGHEGLPETASFCPMCGEVVATQTTPPPAPKAPKEDPHEARTEVISQSEIKARMGEIREKMNKMRGDASSVSDSNKPARPKKTKANRRKKGFSETLWFMQVQNPETMVVDSNTDIEQGDLQDKYTKKQTLEVNVRKEFSLNVDLDDFDD